MWLKISLVNLKENNIKIGSIPKKVKMDTDNTGNQLDSFN
jgi:hypothetical protein